MDQNSGFHGNRKPQLTYKWENDISTSSRLFSIRSFLYLQITRTCITSRTSSNFGQIGPLTTEVAALKRLKNFIMKVAGNQDRHKSLDEFDFGPLVSVAHLYVFLK